MESRKYVITSIGSFFRPRETFRGDTDLIFFFCDDDQGYCLPLKSTGVTESPLKNMVGGGGFSL